MSSWSRFFVRDSGGSGRVRIRYASGVPSVVSGDADGDVCIAEDGANSKVYQLRNSAWVELGAGGGGGSTLGYFNPSAPPETANARDLEFNDAGDATTMVTFNPGSLVGFDKSISNSCLRITSPVQTSATYRMAGAYRDCPTGADWSCWTKLNIASVPNDTTGNAVAGGFLLFDDTVLTDPATADFVVVSYSLQGSAGFLDSIINVQRWNDYQLSGFTQIGSAMNVARSDEHIWLRLRWINSSTTLNVDASADGISWRRFFTNSSIGLTPTRVGLCSYSAVGTPVGNIICSYDFLRFSTSSAIGDMTLGRVV